MLQLIPLQDLEKLYCLLIMSLLNEVSSSLQLLLMLVEN